MRVIHGDMRDVLPTLSGIDAVCVDPPYHLTSIVKRFGGENAAPAQFGKDGAFARASRGFMNKTWDGGDIAMRPETWRLVFDAMKPGAHMVAFGGTRTFHRMWCAIEDAGFEIRDSLMFLHGVGFPKSHNVPPLSRIETHQTYQGFGSALKPAFEPICLARKPLEEKNILANILAHGTGAINIAASRVETPDANLSAIQRQQSNRQTWQGGKASGFAADHEQPKYNAAGRWPANVLHDGSPQVEAAFAAFGEKTVGKLEPHHTLSASDNACMSGPNQARHPRQDFGGDTGTASRFFAKCQFTEDEQVRGKRPGGFGNVGAERGDPVPNGPTYSDAGSPSRFFYCAKADSDDRAWSRHPTVKPIALIRWLLRLITPPGGTVLDCFAGSGTTGEAANLEGFNAILVEKEAEYIADIHKRLGRASGDDTPLFARAAE